MRRSAADYLAQVPRLTFHPIDPTPDEAQKVGDNLKVQNFRSVFLGVGDERKHCDAVCDVEMSEKTEAFSSSPPSRRHSQHVDDHQGQASNCEHHVTNGPALAVYKKD